MSCIPNVPIAGSQHPWGRGEHPWCGALAHSPSIALWPDFLPVAASTTVLQSQMRALLWGSATHDAGWHAWRRLGAVLLA